MSHTMRWTRWTIGSLAVGAVLVMVFSATPPHTAQGQTPASATPTPDPVIVGLQTTVTAQQQTIDSLSQDVERLIEDQELESSKTVWELDKRLLLAACGVVVASAIAGYVGVRTFSALDEKIRHKISATLDRELYQLDPTNLAIYIPEGLERERKRLELSGLKNVKTYTHFNAKASRRGVTIVSIVKDSETDRRDEEAFVKFVTDPDNAFDPTHAAFILYVPGLRVDLPPLLKAYDNVGVANTPTTLAGAVLVVARGLKSVYGEPAKPSVPHSS